MPLKCKYLCGNTGPLILSRRDAPERERDDAGLTVNSRKKKKVAHKEKRGRQLKKEEIDKLFFFFFLPISIVKQTGPATNNKENYQNSSTKGYEKNGWPLMVSLLEMALFCCERSPLWWTFSQSDKRIAVADFQWIISQRWRRLIFPNESRAATTLDGAVRITLSVKVTTEPVGSGRRPRPLG